MNQPKKKLYYAVFWSLIQKEQTNLKLLTISIYLPLQTLCQNSVHYVYIINVKFMNLLDNYHWRAWTILPISSGPRNIIWLFTMKRTKAARLDLQKVQTRFKCQTDSCNWALFLLWSDQSRYIKVKNRNTSSRFSTDCFTLASLSAVAQENYKHWKHL